LINQAKPETKNRLLPLFQPNLLLRKPALLVGLRTFFRLQLASKHSPG